MKKILALLLACAMVISLVACSSTPAETEEPAAEAEAEVVEEATEAEEPA